MLVKFYHLRDENSVPWVTKCLIKYNDNIARGTSICSFKDNPSKSEGRKLSKYRAILALLDKTDKAPVLRAEADIILGLVGDDTEMKSEFNPELTKYEQRLIK